jgi:hypothetical protein
VTFEVTLAGVTVKAGDVGEAFEVAADIIEAVGDRDGLDVTCDGEPDEALTELAREGLRPTTPRPKSVGEPVGEPLALSRPPRHT